MSRYRSESADRERGRSRERRKSAHQSHEDPATNTLSPSAHQEKRGLFRRVFSKSPSRSPSNAGTLREPNLKKDSTATAASLLSATTTREFSGSWNAVFDKKGNLFLSDYRDNHVRMMKAQDIASLFPNLAADNKVQTKNMHTLIRTGVARGGKNMIVENLLVSHPSGIALNSGGMILADTFNHRICEISSKGVMTTLAGNNESREGREDAREGPKASFSFPRGMDVDKEGNIIVADWGSHLIRKIITQGGESAITVTLAGNPKVKGYKDGQGTEARFYRPTDVAVDLEGNVLVADQKNNRIRRITPAGVTSTLVGKEKPGCTDGRRPTFNRPTGISVGPDGSVMVADSNNNLLRVISPLGFTFSVTDGHVFDRPCAVAVDPNGNVVVIDGMDDFFLVPAGLIKELEQRKEAEVKAADERGDVSGSRSQSATGMPSEDGPDMSVSSPSRRPTRDAGTRCRICHEITENNDPLCEYHTMLSGGLSVATEFKESSPSEEGGVRSRADSASPKSVNGLNPHGGSVMDKTKDLLSALSRHGQHDRGNSYSSTRSSHSGRNSVGNNNSFCERLDTRAMLIADPTLERLLVVPVALHFFARFLISECSEENIEFWDSVNKWTYDCDLGNLSNEALLEEAKIIISTYIGENAPRQVNLTSSVVAQVRQAEKINDVVIKILDLREALNVSKAAVMKMLGEDGFRRFLKSHLWQEFLGAAQETQSGPSHSVHLPNGDLYVGETRDGKFHGHGVTTFHNGEKYVGKYKDGFMHGIGEYITKKERFAGEFENDLKHGEGVLYNNEAENFYIEGVWVKDKLNGQGTIHEGSRIFDAIWLDGAVVCKVERIAQRLLGNYVAENIVGSKRVYCSMSIDGVMFGYSKGRSSQQETGTLLWAFLDSVGIDLVCSQVTMRFLKNNTPRTLVIQPCEPMATSNSIIERVDFLENTNHVNNVGLLAVQAKILFARMEEKFKRRHDFSMRLGEVQNTLTELEMTLTELEEESDPNDTIREHALSVDRQQLPDIKKDIQKLTTEQQQLEFYLDTNLFVADYKLLKDLQSRLTEQKHVPLERAPSSKLTFAQRLSLGPPRRASPSSRKNKSGEDLQQVDELVTKIQEVFKTHQIPLA